ncbi:MAG: hypothetical protein ACRD6X_10945, partial [Pyrinomonadaceae bacterium]
MAKNSSARCDPISPLLTRGLAQGETDVNAIRDFIGADSLGYLSLEGMLEAIGIAATSSCNACWTGKY